MTFSGSRPSSARPSEEDTGYVQADYLSASTGQLSGDPTVTAGEVKYAGAAEWPQEIEQRHRDGIAVVVVPAGLVEVGDVVIASDGHVVEVAHRFDGCNGTLVGTMSA